MRHHGPLDNLQSLVTLQITMTMMSAEATAVIAMRLMGMAGLWSVPEGENLRMVQEKNVAFAQAGLAAATAAMAGHAPAMIASAAVKPLRRATRLNTRRLTRSGAKKA